MLIGVPKEIKTNENRIALVPAGAEALTAPGTRSWSSRAPGLGSGFPDDGLPGRRGGTILPTPTRSGSAPK